MDFVKREDQNFINEEYYMEQFQQPKSQMEPIDHPHTHISMEQLHQVMQSSFNSNLAHNFQLPLSPRQMSTLMLKTNQITRNLSINEIAAHLPMNLAEIDLAHNYLNEILRQEDNAQSRSADVNLVRMHNDLEMQHGLAHLNEHELHKSLIMTAPNNLTHELDLSLHMNRQNEEHVMCDDQARRTQVNVQDNHMLEQNLAHRLDQSLVSIAQKIDQRLYNANLNMNEAAGGSIEHNPHNMPFHIKAEQDENLPFYDSVGHAIGNVSNANGHAEMRDEQHAAGTINNLQHQGHQSFAEYNTHLPNIPGLNVDLYSRQQNFVQQFAPLSTENPQNLIVHRQFQNTSPYHKSQDGDRNGAKNEYPKENHKPTIDQNKVYYSEYDIDYEINSERNSENDSGSQNKLVIADEIAMSIKGEYGCYRCNEIFPTKRGLKQHTKSCTRNGLNVEVIEKVGKFTCNQCAYRCQSAAVLKTHERKHSGEKPFSCTFCDYKSGQKNNVAKHILVHMKEKPFRCQFCEYKCAQKNNLVVHERTHTGYKPFACTYCPYRTVQKPNLVKHMYLHTNQKPFSCDLCGYKCVQKTNLNKHKLRHLNEKNDGKLDNVKASTKQYRPRQKSVVCPHCTYRCVQKTSLEKHIQFKHSDILNSSAQNLGTREDFECGLNLMKNTELVEETVHNLSVKKSDAQNMFVNEACQGKIMEPLQVQS